MDKDFLHTKVIREVLSQISVGIYRDGQRLPAERKLCSEFGISRGTLRKALADLEKMGVVQIRAQSGAYVQKISESSVPTKILPKNAANVTIEEIIFARKAIELAAIELASKRITTEEIKKLDQCVEMMKKNIDDLPEYLRYDIAFHEELVKSSKNSALITAFEAIAEYHRYSQIFSSSSDAGEKDAIKYHNRILEALSQGDTRKSVTTLRRHFESMLESQK
jgi:GntR family transcriptional repressor for pyruvate dehydrogenase complex